MQNAYKRTFELVDTFEKILLLVFLIPNDLYEDYSLLDALKDEVRRTHGSSL